MASPTSSISSTAAEQEQAKNIAELEKQVAGLRSSFLNLLQSAQLCRNVPDDGEGETDPQFLLNKSFAELRTEMAHQSYQGEVATKHIVLSAQGMMALVTKLKLHRVLYDQSRKYATTEAYRAALTSQSVSAHQELLQLSREVTAATSQAQSEYFRAQSLIASWNQP
eukprot:g16023.t1